MNLIPIGLELTVYGMGIVFLLLALLALLISLLLRFDRPSAEEPLSVEPEPDSDYPDGLDAESLAAITIAVHQHRGVRSQQSMPMLRRLEPETLPSRSVIIGRKSQTSSWQNHRRS